MSKNSKSNPSPVSVGKRPTIDECVMRGHIEGFAQGLAWIADSAGAGDPGRFLKRIEATPEHAYCARLLPDDYSDVIGDQRDEIAFVRAFAFAVSEACKVGAALASGRGGRE